MLRMIIHYDNQMNFLSPVMHLRFPNSKGRDILPSRFDTFGPIFEVDLLKAEFRFKFQDMSNGVWDGLGLDRYYKRYGPIDGPGLFDEIWCKAYKPFIYPLQPNKADPIPVPDFPRPQPLKVSGNNPAGGDIPNLIYCAGCRGNCKECPNSKWRKSGSRVSGKSLGCHST